MTQVHVDISLFSKGTAFGRISGVLDLVVIPQIGDAISFLFPKGGLAVPRSARLIRVIDRIISANGEDRVALSLADLTVETTSDAQHIMTFFEEAYGFFGEPFGDA